jgi:hypothetical protein
MNAAGVVLVSVIPDNKPRTIITRDEKKFDYVTITDRNENQISISNSSGTKIIQLENLPAGLQKELGYTTLEQARKEQADCVIAKARAEKPVAESRTPELRLVKSGASNDLDSLAA